MKLLSYLQKTLSVSRREFTDMVQEKVISINDILVEGFGDTIGIDDTISIKLPNGTVWKEIVKKIPFAPPKLILFHKPKGCVVSKDDPHNKTIFELLPVRRRDELWYIGRLDKDSTGLLLLTNDTKLVDHYESPQNNIHKVYQLEIDKPLRTKDKTKMKKGIEVTEEGFLPAEDPGNHYDLLSCVTVNYQKTPKGKHEVIITLNEGKKRQLRRLMKALGYKIYKLHRLKVGKRHLGDLKVGKRRIEKIKRGEKKSKKSKKKQL